MTISDQLSFSILSAPVASADRRALSQAWYSALYGAACKRPAAPAAGSKKTRSAGAAVLKNTPARSAALQKLCAPQGHAAPKRAAFAPPQERRGPRLYLARRIANLVALRTAKRSAATFVLDGSRARVRVLVTAKAGRVQMIAVCSKKHEANVAAALAQARYVAAASGVALYAGSRGDTRC